MSDDSDPVSPASDAPVADVPAAPVAEVSPVTEEAAPVAPAGADVDGNTVPSRAEVPPAAELPEPELTKEEEKSLDAKPAELTAAEVKEIQAEPRVSVIAPEVVTLEQQLGVERVDILPQADGGFLVLIAHYRIQVSLAELAASGDIVGVIREKYRAQLPQ